ncbi:membrane protein [Calothrix sp. 336/3]|nr:membrane protein [Calothrix sp. 336/3]
MKLDTAPVNFIATEESGETAFAASAERSSLAHGELPTVTTTLPKREPVIVTFATTFVTIFLAEIGDKTQLSTLLMSAESHQPWVVFLGSGAALITTSLLGVLLGSWISTRLAPKTVETAAGIMLLIISVMLFGDVIFG